MKEILKDPNKYPMHMRMDIVKRNSNITAGFELCDNCDGTGNELYSMYGKCPDCNGTGKKTENSK